MTTDPTRQAPLNLALAITELEVGGAERCLVNLALGLDPLRFAPVVYSLGPRPVEGRDQLVVELEERGVGVHFVGVTRISQFMTALHRLRKLLRQQQPDLLQTFLFHANVLGAVAGRREKVPRIVTGIRVAEPDRRRQWIERRFMRRADAHVCVSESVAQYAREAMRLASDKITVIPNGIDMAKYSSATPADLSSAGIDAQTRLIVFVGRLHEQKGVAHILRACRQVFRSLPDYELLLVGEGPQRQLLQALAKKLEIETRVHFIGFRHDVPAVLARADLLILASQWEGMPNVVLEAMASAMPVVTTNVEGIEELLGPLALEQVVARADEDELAKRVGAILNDANKRAELGAKNRRRVADHFSLARMVRRYEDLYERLGAPARTVPKKSSG